MVKKLACSFVKRMSPFGCFASNIIHASFCNKIYLILIKPFNISVNTNSGIDVPNIRNEITVLFSTFLLLTTDQDDSLTICLTEKV